MCGRQLSIFIEHNDFSNLLLVIMMESFDNKTLIILGMHRSGTSLVAQWLNNCGLHLGDVLLGKAHSNKFGHFEDKDFLEMHREILQDNALDYDVDVDCDIVVSNYHQEKAKMLVDLKNKLHPQWGWKEPRTCLFVDTWDKLISDAKYLIVYRDFKAVVDSLLRREYNAFARRKNLIIKYKDEYHFRQKLQLRANHFLRTWNIYNSRLLSFVSKKSKNDFILVNQDELLSKSGDLVNKIVQEWQFNLVHHEISSVFKKGHLKKGVRFKVDYEEIALEEAERIYIELGNRSTFD